MLRAIVVVGLMAVTFAAQAQTWPAKPVRIIVAFPPGGSTDIITRALAEKVSAPLGQTVLVENRAGASGNVGADAVLKAGADGYTLLATADALASTPHLFKVSFDPLKDFAAIVQFSRQPVVLAAHPSVGVQTIQELVALARRQPGLAYATSGAGSLQHMAAEWFAKLAAVSLTHVPYKGGGQAIVDLVGGQVPLGSLGNTPLLPHYRAGKLRILAQTTRARSASLPDVPTYEEAGFAGLVLDQWLGLFAPAGVPREVVLRMNAEIVRAMADPTIRERFAQNGLDAVGGTPEQFDALLRSDFEKFGRLVKELNIRID